MCAAFARGGHDMSILVSDLVIRVEKKLRMVAGIAVQQYAEDYILHSIQTAFDRLFLKRFWDAYCFRATWTLDGTTGKVTTDVSALTNPLKNFADIQHIWYENDADTLPRLRNRTNIEGMTGTRARKWEPCAQTPSRIFRVIPITSTGDVHVRYRSKPDDFSIDDTIYLDSLLLELSSALAYLSSDNANISYINLVQAELDAYYNTLDAAQDDDEIELTGEYGRIPQDWVG